ncbi:Sweetie-like protein [Thalictrum thalictroides]|uniref:Sweetie-like protein n=1 Tax=Thalictrum thalictroides TaxID=46969 RepID=A0A7J6VH37_THATH|nr:Sweetie-like protein [Thalictrum thalictroides]
MQWIGGNKSYKLPAIRLRYHHSDSELPDFALQAMNMLRGHSTVDSHALACVLYILRVGITDQMSENTQTSFLVLLGNQLESPDLSPPMIVAALRTLSYILTTLGEVPLSSKDVLDNTIVAALSHPERLVRIEAALTLRAFVEVDPTCVGGLISYAVTTLNALRESISFDKGNSMQVELDSLHGQATVLAALVAISPKLPLGYPARLPQSVLDVAKKLLNEFSRNAIASLVEKEAGWLLLASLINSIPKEELEDQVFDILSLWASLFGGSSDYIMKEGEDLSSEIRVWSAAVDALTAFVKCFISPNMVDLKTGILLQPILVYLGRALSHISLLAKKQLSDIKPAMDLFIIRTLIAYRSLSDPVTYKSDHPQLIQICTTPFRDPSGCEESSCLRLLLDKRDAWLGPWIPGRDWFEDELRAFQGGKDGLMPCVWENELSTFPQPETTSKMLVNQKLLCFGTLFAIQDSGGMLSLLGMLEQCLKTGKKQSWHPASVTNACVGLLSGLKALLALRPQPLGLEILSSAQAIFQGILSEGDISAAQRRASSEGLGLLARLGNDIFTARMTRSLLGDLVGATDSSYTGSIALSLGCIHRSAGGMALSTLVPATVNSISLLAKSHNTSLQIWSLHGLLLTIEAAGLSFVSQVQATLLLSMEILLSEENGWVDLRQGIGRLINAIVAVLGPELSPGSIFFSRCKSVVAEISSGQETSTLHESVRFTQQLALFAPQAVSMHAHVRTLLPTLTSRQPTLRHLAVSTLRHLIEKDPVAIIAEQIEENLFFMLDEETDPEIGNLVRATTTRLLYTSCSSCSSHWISICQNMILATSSRRNTRSEHDPPIGSDGDARSYFGEDDENMVDSAQGQKKQVADVLGIDRKRESHLRYRTRFFAAECLSHVPVAVGNNHAHFDLSLARTLSVKGQPTGDWLVLHIQDLIAIAYQISTIQFENMQPLGVKLLCTVMDKFENTPDPELPGHFLMEQYQAQLVSAVRTSLETTSSPLLLEAGLHLATKILTSSIISGDQAAIKRIFSLISRPLNDFKELYYPSFAEWVAYKIKVRLLAAHASVKAYVYAFLRRRHRKVADEYLALIPQFSQSSSMLGKYWIWILKDYCYKRFCLQYNGNYNTFLEGIQSPLVTSKLQQCLEEAWPVILQATVLDAVPADNRIDVSSAAVDEAETTSNLISGHRMVELESGEFQFLWGFSLLILFQGQSSIITTEIVPHIGPKVKPDDGSVLGESYRLNTRCDEIAFMVFQSLSTKNFFRLGFLTNDICKELLQVFAHAIQMEHSWTNLVIPFLSQIVQVCPDEFYETEGFASLAMEICVTYLYKLCQSPHDHQHHADLVSALFMTLKTLLDRYRPQVQTATLLASLLTSYTCLRDASTEPCISKATSFVQSTELSLKKYVEEKAKCEDDGLYHLRIVFGALQNVIATMIQDFHRNMHLLETKKTGLSEQLKMKLLFCLEHAFSVAKVFHGNQHLQASKGDNQFLYQVYKCCTNCIKMTLSASEMQVQTVGINVLKNLVQRELVENKHEENHSFIMFFIGELVGDMFQIVHKMIKKPVSKEAVAITGECLRLLVLIQTLSKVAECQKGIIKLLLEIIVMVVSESVDDHSKESNEIRTTAVRLVSHLAKIPSSAAHFRDVLLAMPVIRREKLQDIIRASVTVDNTVMKPTASPLIIKIPVPTEQSKKNDSQVYTPVSSKTHSDKGSMDEEDDWDAFQSFPANADAPIANSEAEEMPVEVNPVENVSILEHDFDNNGRFQKYSSPQILEDVTDAQLLEGSGYKIILSQRIQNDSVENDHSDSDGVSIPSVIDGDKFEEIVRNEDIGCQVSPEFQNLVDGKELNCENFVDDAPKGPMKNEGGESTLASSDSMEVAHETGIYESSENSVGQNLLKDIDSSNGTADFSEPKPLEHVHLGTNYESGRDASELQHTDVDVGSHHGHKDASEAHCTEDGDEVPHNDHDLSTMEQMGEKAITEEENDDLQQDNTINPEA